MLLMQSAPLWDQPEDGRVTWAEGSWLRRGTWVPQTSRVSNHNEPCHQLGAEILREGQAALRGQSTQGRTHEWGHTEGARAGDSWSPVSISASLIPRCVILLTYPCLPLAQNCPTDSHPVYNEG